MRCLQSTFINIIYRVNVTYDTWPICQFFFIHIHLPVLDRNKGHGMVYTVHLNYQPFPAEHNGLNRWNFGDRLSGLLWRGLMSPQSNDLYKYLLYFNSVMYGVANNGGLARPIKTETNCVRLLFVWKKVAGRVYITVKKWYQGHRQLEISWNITKMAIRTIGWIINKTGREREKEKRIKNVNK